MRKILTLLAFIFVLQTVALATGEPSTYFNIFVPPNNDAVQRNVCLIVTAIYDNTSFTILDDNADGDSDDNVTGTLMSGQSYILYIKDNGINDDALYASGGTLKRDGDYFTITSTNLVYAAMSCDSDWQHDFVPAVDKSSVGEKFIIYAPKISSSKRDLNVFAFSDNTTVTISKISASATTQTGYTNINLVNKTVVAQRTINIGQDIIYYYQDGRNVMNTGETYMVESNKPVSVQYGALYQNERDGGGYVPSSNGSCSGELFYFGVPYQATGEQEIRVVSWDNANAVKLERYSNGSWVAMSNWTMDRGKAKDWVGKNNGNVSYPTVFRISCSAGKKVSVFEANWLETGSPGTSDIATMVASEAGNTSGKVFLVYMAPPGNETNVVNPATGTFYGQKITHIYLFSREGATVTVKDAYSNGGDINRTYNIAPGRYVDCFLTETEWKSIYNGTGTVAGGPERPYLMVESNNNISVMNTNFNDNWMMYFGSSLIQSFSQEGSSSQTIGIPGDIITVNSNIQLESNGMLTGATLKVIVGDGAIPISSTFKNLTDNTSIEGDINFGPTESVITFSNVPALNSQKQYQVQTEISLLPSSNDGTAMANNTIVVVESILSGTMDGAFQQSTITQGIQNRTAVTSNLLFSICGSGELVNTLNNTWGIAWVDYDNDDDDDIFITDKDADRSNLLFRNDGNGIFTKITAGVLVTDKAISVASTWGDIDNDGDVDVFVANDTQKKSELYINQGSGNFSKKVNTGLSQEPGYYHGASWTDFNNDGFLDLMLTNYFPTRFHELWRGIGDGTFTSETSVITMESNRSLTPLWADYDNDGWQDLFIPNAEGNNNSLYHNDQGTFTKITTGSIVNDGGNSVAACWGDYNNDGWLDLFVANASNENNFLYRNNGNGTFTKVTTGIVVTDGGQSHGCSWVDIDNDSDLDLYVTNDQGSKALYINKGDASFEKKINEVISMDYGNSFGHAWSDYDKNGQLDLMVATHTANKDYLFCNNGNGNKWISIKLKGTRSNRSAIGAKIRVKSGGLWQTKEVQSQNGFASQNSMRTSFGLNSASIADSVEITWPSGYRQVLTNLNSNQHLSIAEPTTSKLKGVAYRDGNNNCVYDENETLLANMSIRIMPSGITAVTNNVGEYEANVANGNYTLNGVATGLWNASCGSASFAVNNSVSNTYTRNFAFNETAVGVDLASSFASTAWRRGFVNQSSLVIKNSGSELATGSEVSVTYPTHMFLLEASTPWHEKNGNTYTWLIDNLGINETFIIHLSDSVGLSATIGDELVVSCQITGGQTDLNAANNSFEFRSNVVGAVDPNDIQVSPKGDGEEGFISREDWVNYTIRFQNVGNYPAWRVTIEDQLPSYFDLKTIEVVSATHHHGYSISDNGMLTFVFNDINLVDSTQNEAQSHGSIIFKVRPLRDLTGGEQLLNDAAIVFDYEGAINTNQVTNKIKYTATPENNVVRISPNPSSGHTRFTVDRNGFHLQDNVMINDVEILSQDGRIVYTQGNMNVKTFEMNVGEFIPGMYMVRITDEKKVIYFGKLAIF